MDRKSLGFSVFLIHALAEKWEEPLGRVYQVLNDSGILDDYIVPYYDVLHTQGRDYLVEDITGFVNERDQVFQEERSDCFSDADNHR